MDDQPEWEIELNLSDLPDPTANPLELLARAKDVVTKKYEEQKEKLEQTKEVKKSRVAEDGLWRSDREEVLDLEMDILQISRGIEDVEVDGPDVTIHTITYKPPEFEDDDEDVEVDDEVVEDVDAPDGPHTETGSGPDDKIPILLVHGLGGTAVEFRQNYRVLSQDRKVYGIDIPGFGLSSRNTCYMTGSGDDPKKAVEQCEEKLVKFLDNWRKKQKIDKMIIVGHSMGGYVSMVYAMKHREHVQQLILLEPWGMLTMEESEELKKMNPLYKHNSLAQEWAMALSQPFKLKPFTLLRLAGNAAATLIYDVLGSKSTVYGKDSMKYFIAVNTLSDPSGSGEDMFGTFSNHTYMYPVLSLYSRVPELPSYPPTTIVYGTAHMFNNEPISFVDEGLMFQKKMQERGFSDVEILEAPESGHHPHAENAPWFHEQMERILKKIDSYS